jgi:hypothetical protein
MWCDKHKHDMTLHDIPYCKQLTWMFTCLQHVPFFGKKHDGRFFHNSSADPSPCFFNAAEVQILTAQRMSFLFALLRWCTGWGHSYTLQKYLWEIKLVVNQYMKTAGGAPRKKIACFSVLQYTTIYYTIYNHIIYNLYTVFELDDCVFSWGWRGTSKTKKNNMIGSSILSFWKCSHLTWSLRQLNRR